MGLEQPAQCITIVFSPRENRGSFVKTVQFVGDLVQPHSINEAVAGALSAAGSLQSCAGGEYWKDADDVAGSSSSFGTRNHVGKHVGCGV